MPQVGATISNTELAESLRSLMRNPPGMEKLGELPGIPRAPLPPGLAKPAPTPTDVRAMIGNYGRPPTPAEAQRNVELLDEYGNLMPEGGAQMGAGAYDFPKAPMHGAGEIARGFMKAGIPAATGALMATPVPTLMGLAVGTGVGYGSNKAALELGFDPETAQDIGDVAALLSGVGTGIVGMTRRLGVARTVTELNAKVERLTAKIPTATPAQAEMLRAQIAGLTKASAELAPPEPVLAPTAARPEKLPESTIPAPEALPERTTPAATTPAPEAPPAPYVPLENAPPPAFPQTAERSVAIERAGQLNEVSRLGQQAQRKVGIEPEVKPFFGMGEPAPKPLGSEAGALLLPDIKAGSEKFERQWLDRNAPIKNFNRSKGGVPFEKDPYIWAAGLESRAQGKFMEFERNLHAIEYPAVKAGTWDDTVRYMRDERILARLQENPSYKVPSEVLPDGTLKPRVLADIQAEMAAIEAKHGPAGMTALKSTAQSLRDLQAQAYREYEASGMLKAGEANKKLSTPVGQKYISLGREKFLAPVEGEEVTLPKRGLANAKQAVHKLGEEGSDLPLANETELIVRDTMRMIRAAETNRVAQLQADLEFNPAFAGSIRKLKNARGPVPAEKPKPGEGTFKVWRNGTEFRYAAPKDVANAMIGITEPGIGVLERAGRFMNSGLRMGSTTYYLPFWATNIVRDWHTAYWRSPIGFSLNDWGYGFAKAFKMESEYVDFMKSGGGMSGFFSYDRGLGLKDVARRVQESPGRRRAEAFLGPNLINPMRGVEYLANVIEMAPRIGLAHRAQRMGKSDLYSGYLGRNITVDFNKMGSYMKSYNAVNWPFNAKVQASANFINSLKDNPKTAFPKLATSVALPVIAAWGWNTTQFPEVWDSIDQATKDRNMVVIYGKGKNEDGTRYNQLKLFRKPDAVAFFGNILEAMLENVRGVNPKKASTIGLEAASTLFPINFMERGRISPRMAASDIVPMPLRFGPELWANQRLRTGIPIEQDGTRKGTWWNRYTNDTTKSIGGKLAIPLSRLTPGVGPQQLQFLGDTFFGGLSQTLNRPLKGEDSFLKYVTEPSGMGQLGRQLGEARVVGPEQREADESRLFQQIADDRKISNDRILDAARDEAKALPEGQREARIVKLADSGKITEDMQDTLLKEFEDDKLKLTSEEREIKQGSAYGKALYLLDQQKQLSQKDYDAKIDRWEEKGLINDSVYTEMDNIEEERKKEKAFPGQGVTTAGVNMSMLIPSAWTPRKGNPAEENNNPGNIKNNDGSWQKFSTPEDGLAAHYDYVQRAITGEHPRYDPKSDLFQFFSTYAPKGDGKNDPRAYARFVAGRLRVPVTTKVSTLQPRMLELLNAIQDMEGWHGPRLARVPTQVGAVDRGLADELRRVMREGR